MGRKEIVWTFQATNKQNLTREDLDNTKERKPLERNWVFYNRRTKQRHKDKLYNITKQ